MYINNGIDYIKFLKKKNVIIFGAGGQGKRIQHSLDINGIKVLSFCDNDKGKVNTKLNGINIIDFNQLSSLDLTNKMIVIASIFRKEIEEQLMENNIFNYIDWTEIDFSGVNESYYDENYFNWQKSIGELSAKVSDLKKYIGVNDCVLDFGSGGGYFLNNIQAKAKIGIEINDYARKFAEEMGVNSVKYIENIEDDFADVIISTSTLGHLENPLGILKALKNKLKAGGKIIVQVPHHCTNEKYQKNAINNQFFTWNELTLGNLFKQAGYFIYQVETIYSKWPDNYLEMYERMGKEEFNQLSKLVGTVEKVASIRIIAYK
ncbi:methyltransferase domain-containing protein [Clostridium sp. JS66]|uniref:methyltransferase domain-containing protein n=1 Tax=Clostridium sp. JS66 TaxID=3064705 RepID=UPI00298D7906|nr:methyltransferase domain-containing protein [Clostridium sp. JS66]WPC41025.1 methyltransferase domain-containing protein [Clostridium sp. JS66]